MSTPKLTEAHTCNATDGSLKCRACANGVPPAPDPLLTAFKAWRSLTRIQHLCLQAAELPGGAWTRDVDSGEARDVGVFLSLRDRGLVTRHESIVTSNWRLTDAGRAALRGDQ